MELVISKLPEEVQNCICNGGEQWSVYRSKIGKLNQNNVYKLYRAIQSNKEFFSVDIQKSLEMIRKKVFKKNGTQQLSEAKIVKAVIVTPDLKPSEAELFQAVLNKRYQSPNVISPEDKVSKLLISNSYALEPHLPKDLFFIDINKREFRCNFLLAMTKGECFKHLYNRAINKLELDCSSSVVQSFINYLTYSQKDFNLNDQEFIELHDLANKFQLAELVLICEKEEQRRLSSQNPTPQPRQRRKSIEAYINEINRKVPQVFIELKAGEISVEVKDTIDRLSLLFEKCLNILGTVKFNRLDALVNFLMQCPVALSFPHVELLNLEGCDELNNEQLQQIFAKFPNLTSVVIGNRTLQLNQIFFASLPDRPRLKNLMIVGKTHLQENEIPQGLSENIIFVVDSVFTQPVKLRGNALYIEIPLNGAVKLDFSLYPTHVNDRLLQMIAAKSPNISELDLSGCPITDYSLHVLLKASPLITSLCLKDCHAINNQALSSLENCKQLKGLNLANCHLLTDAVLNLVQGNLQVLDISGCSSLTQVAFQIILARFALSLSYFGFGGNAVEVKLTAPAANLFLRLTDLKLVGMDDYDPFNVFLMNRPSIKSIKFERCGAPFAQFVQESLNLRSIYFDDCRFGLQNYVDYFLIPQLNTLSFKRSLIAYSDLQSLNQLIELETVDLSKSQNLAVAGFTHLFSCLPHLKDFRANGCEAVWIAIESLGVNCPDLKSLSLEHTGHLGVDRLQRILKYLPKLQTLNLMGCTTEKNLLEKFKARLPDLEVIF